MKSKALLLLVSLIMSASVHANDAGFARFGEWADMIVGPTSERKTVTFTGRTQNTNILCELYVTKFGETGEYYLSLGVGENLVADPENEEKNQYFGNFVMPEYPHPESSLQWKDGSLIFRVDTGDEILNLEVELDENQRPIKVVGQSTYYPYPSNRHVCVLSER